ncbi:MAG TPA: hypothetical protein VGS79_17640 [Puia sp.]|nr:hypothetical protein [Puia sp.]
MTHEIQTVIHKRYLILIQGNCIASTPTTASKTIYTYKKKKKLKKEAHKDAFLFSCYTGLRWIDVKILTWGAIKDGQLTHRTHYST